MYVCVCNALREDDIREACREQPTATPEQVYASLHAEPDCGTCLVYAQHVIDLERAQMEMDRHAVVP
ncbi:MAG: bacterioferritin-associated ferredoxin [Alphaproteobacteria bacterium]